MANHVLFEKGDLPEFVWDKTKADPDVWPTLITSGCAENLLGFNDAYNPWTPDTWVEEFKRLGLSVGYWDIGRDKLPYPLDEKQQEWIVEDSDGFQDTSGGYWTYPTVALYKGRRWFAPFVEYGLTYDPATGSDNDDPRWIANRFTVLTESTRRHLRVITDAFETLPFDTMIELLERDADRDYPLGKTHSGAPNFEYLGYRMYLDLDAAMNHFGTFENYRAWMRENLGYYVIEESPV